MNLPPSRRILLEKDGQWTDRTDSVRNFRHEGNLVRVTFQNGRTFSYGMARVAIVGNKVKVLPLPVVHDRITQTKLQVTGVERWVNLVTGIGWLRFYPMRGRPIWRLEQDVELHQDALGRSEEKSPRAYLRAIADAVQPVSERSADDVQGSPAGLALRPKVESLPAVPRDSILGSFLTGKTLRNSHAAFRPVIAPWDTNMSQLTALHAANTSQVSVIQGPPGTGKTQTILALIANALVHGETIAVVSTNNTAVDNVKMKLDDAGLGFLTARLGSKKHREEFVDNQQPLVPAHLLGWGQSSAPVSALVDQAAHSVQMLGTGMATNNQLAELREEERRLNIESVHFGQTAEDEEAAKKLHLAVSNMSSADYMEEMLRAEQPDGAWWLRLFTWFNFKNRRLQQLLAAVTSQTRREIWYKARLRELRLEIGQREEFLKTINWESLTKRAQELSLVALQAAVALRRAGKRERTQFSATFWGKEDAFLREYPIVFSTMHSLLGTFKPGTQFDWVIVDEASQSDLLTGILTMSCARRLVVVGDEQQLPRVLTTADEKYARSIERRFGALLGKRPWLSYVDNSFLGAVLARWDTEIPVTLLREHYRCAPLIAGFINQRFYGGQLQIMTEGDASTLMPIQVALGRGKTWDLVNRHQVEEIANKISQLVDCPERIGVIAPYRNQVIEVRKRIADLDPLEIIEVDTVHAFQGREKPIVILTPVDGKGEFVNDARLVNVAVSRAQTQLILVADEQDAVGPGLIGDLIRYVRYHNVEAVRQSQIRSVFELLSTAQVGALKQLQTRRGRAANQESPAEAIIANLLETLFAESEFDNFAFIQEYALLDLVAEVRLSSEERGLALRGSRVDFLIYDKLDKGPLGVIEVDGATFHRRGSTQYQRDALKNMALERAGIPLLRLPTDGAGEIEKIREFLIKARIYRKGEASILS